VRAHLSASAPLKRAPLPRHRARHARPCCRATFHQPPPPTVADRCLRPGFPRRLFVDQRPRNHAACVHLTSICCRTEAKPISPSSPLPFPAPSLSPAPLATAAADEQCRTTPLPSVPAGVPPRRSTVRSTEHVVSEPPEHHQATVRLRPPCRPDASVPEPHRIHTPSSPPALRRLPTVPPVS
jgi:hypothetical protein